MGVNLSKILLSVGAGGAASWIFYSMWTNERQGDDVPRTPILGLRNCGNSCFLNCVLQAYASCKFMLGWLRLKDEECNLIEGDPVTPLVNYRNLPYPFIAAMYRAILVMNRDIIVDDQLFAGKIPGDIINGLRLHGHRVSYQQEQDAYEMFQLIALVLNFEVEQSVRRKQAGSMGALGPTLTDAMPVDSESKETEPSVESVTKHEDVDLEMGCGDWAMVGEEEETGYRICDGIYSKRRLQMKWDYKVSPKSPFHYLMFAQMQCIVCMAKTKARLESAESLNLPLPPPEACPPVISISDLLVNYMKPGLVHNVDCESCTARAIEAGNAGGYSAIRKVKSSFFKYNFIGKLPNTLCIHIPRCLWGRFGMTKRAEYVRFPERLNLSVLRRLYDPNGEDTEGQDTEKEKTDNESGLRRFKNSEYHLLAVITHVGSGVDGGHFVTYRRRPSPNPSVSHLWYYISDEIVQQVPFSCVMGTKAYMLFYEKTHNNV